MASGEVSRRRRRSVRTLIGTVVLFLLLGGISEAILRFGLGLGNPVLIVPDPACKYILKPDQNIFRFFSHTRTNHYGMRSDPISPLHAPSSLRILFVGDSITYGTSQVDQSQIFTEILHRDLPSIVHRPVEVLNASAGAWAIDNELSYVRSRGIFESDLVLLVLNDGDVTQPRSTMAEVGDGLPHARPRTALGELYTRFIVPKFLHIVSRPDAGDSVSVNADGVIMRNLDDLNEFNELVRRQGAKLAIVYAPFRRDLPNLSSGAGLILKKWSASHQVPIFDLESAELSYSAQEITLDNGIHFSAKGNLVVAQEIEKLWPAVLGQ